ncbi:MAG: metallophosphoesterase family protein [Lachnospiraceae bacterium]|nr:metallophosphoesterase family protein [Lachnospiraceae bacterium]
MATWLTADLHLCHDKDFIWGARGFSCVEEMNEEIVKRYNSVVAPDDDVFILGDLMLGDDSLAIPYLRQLNGHINVIRGNHDSDARCNIYNTLGMGIYGATYLKYRGRTFFLSHYPAITANYDDDKPNKVKVMSLCGHTHTTNPFIDLKERNMYAYHVEVDAHDCYPVELDYIIREMAIKTWELKG